MKRIFDLKKSNLKGRNSNFKSVSPRRKLDFNTKKIFSSSRFLSKISPKHSNKKKFAFKGGADFTFSKASVIATGTKKCSLVKELSRVKSKHRRNKIVKGKSDVHEIVKRENFGASILNFDNFEDFVSPRKLNSRK